VYRYCEVCGFGLYDRISYNRHSSRHANLSLPKYKCKECALELTTSNELNIHLKIHDTSYEATPRQESIVERRTRAQLEGKRARAGKTRNRNTKSKLLNVKLRKNRVKQDTSAEKSELAEASKPTSSAAPTQCMESTPISPEIKVEPEEYERLARRLARRSILL